MRSVEEAVTATLRDAILAGELKPGTWLRQEALSAQLGVSRIPLRDALRRLASDGLVRVDPRRGSYVASLTVDDVREIYELRLLLEPRCIAAAVGSLDDIALRRLDERFRAMRKARTAAEGLSARRAFYSDLYGLSGKARMTELIMRLRDDVHRYHVMARSAESTSAHDELMRLLHARDGRAAAKLIRDHLSDAARDLVAVLRAEQKNGNLSS
jgi:DNA-binding GntR family transcriptional regulator